MGYGIPEWVLPRTGSVSLARRDPTVLMGPCRMGNEPVPDVTQTGPQKREAYSHL